MALKPQHFFLLLATFWQVDKKAWILPPFMPTERSNHVNHSCSPVGEQSFPLTAVKMELTSFPYFSSLLDLLGIFPCSPPNPHYQSLFIPSWYMGSIISANIWTKFWIWDPCASSGDHSSRKRIFFPTGDGRIIRYAHVKNPPQKQTFSQLFFIVVRYMM